MCIDCSTCKKDYDDHVSFHRALHMNCKFCSNIAKSIPFPRFVVGITEGYWPSFHTVYVSASQFQHYYGVIEPLKQLSGYSCDKCGHHYKIKGDLKRHEISHHFGEKYTCACCELRFTREDNMNDHMKMHSEQKPKFQCDVCKEDFQKKSNYKRHCQGFRKCEECSQVFCSLKQVQEHKRGVHLINNCELCNKSFQDEAHLKRHKQAGSTKNKCDKCSASFCTRLDLLKHRKQNHKELYECNICSKKFRSKVGFRMHCAKRDEKNCNQCEKSFCSPHDLKLHSYLHLPLS